MEELQAQHFQIVKIKKIQFLQKDRIPSNFDLPMSQTLLPNTKHQAFLEESSDSLQYH